MSYINSHSLDSPAVDIPGYGTTAAVLMCERLDIKSSKDADKLKKAKDEVYLKGFYEGVMIVGECTGMKVCAWVTVTDCIQLVITTISHLTIIMTLYT